MGNKDINDEEMTVELELEDGSKVLCAIITILTVQEQDYIALLPLDENGENIVKENDEVVEEVPSDGDLIARSKELINNFSDLLAGCYGYESKSYSFSNLETEVFKLENQREFANIIGNTFVDNATAWKYVPYYEKDGIYYGVNGSGGFMGAGSFIFEYKVENKTTSTAHVRIEYIECYDEVVPDKISACQDNPWNEVFVIILDLSILGLLIFVITDDLNNNF